MDLIIDSKIINAPMMDILSVLQSKNSHGYLSTIIDKGEYISVTCPFHKDGHESHPSCSVYADNTNKDITYGTVHCFTCGAKTSLIGLVSHVLGFSTEEAKVWLQENFSSIFLDVVDTSVFDLKMDSEEQNYLDESILDQYNYFHPYVEQRHISREIAAKFKIGYDVQAKAITFPVWDEHNRLVMITKRSVNSKHFFIPARTNKPIYLLNYIINNNITEVTVVESQINALTLWTWGIPAIALFGTGSKYQYNILRTSGVRIFHLAFDGDEAGDKGAQRFIANMPSDVLLDVVNIPRGKDINDLSYEEYMSCIH